MPRHPRGTRIPDFGARQVAGRMCFAAAAEGLGGLYGSTCLERTLCFSPSARAERRLSSDRTPESHSAKRSCPTGGCKKWLHGHVVSDQTLSLIAKTYPKVAQRMRQARDSDVVKALMASPAAYRFIGSRICNISPELFGNYLGCMALGHCDPIFASRLSADLLQRALNGGGVDVLVAIIGLDRQLASPRAYATAKRLENAFAVALRNAAKAHPEIAFAKDAFLDVWSQREPMRGVQTPPQVIPFPWRKCSWPNTADPESPRPSCVKGAPHSASSTPITRGRPLIKMVFQ